jgi:hypothetical protein
MDVDLGLVAVGILFPMAEAKRPHPEHKAAVCRHLGRLLDHHGAGRIHAKGASLKESFELYSLPLERIRDAAIEPTGFLKALTPTGIWHHQIHHGGRPAAFARSLVPAEETSEATVQSVFFGPLAVNMAPAIETIDRIRNSADVAAYLVVITAYQVHCFLLAGPENHEVLLIDRGGRRDLDKGDELVPSQKFLMDLVSRAPTRGIIPPG